jgi:hypothetical protein
MRRDDREAISQNRHSIYFVLPKVPNPQNAKYYT